MMPVAGAMTWFWQIWLAAVVFIFPVPHTIALRNLLLLVGIVVLVWSYRHALPRLASWLKPAAWWLTALTAWIVFHSITVAPAPILALDQFRANWLMPLMIGAVGAWAVTQMPRGSALQAVIAALAAHMLWLLGWQFKLWLIAGAWPFKATPFAAYDYQATINGFFLTLLVADRLAWILEKDSPLKVGQWPGWALLLLSLVCDLVLQSRNSTAMSVTMLLAASLILLRRRSRRWRLIVVATGMVVSLGAGSLKFDNNRWPGLSESLIVGWSSPSMYWMTGDVATRPVTPSGAVLEESAYARAAYARKALDLVAEHPMGIGFGHDSFGRAIALKYDHAGLGSSHSGWFDFALGTGLPGLALLIATAIVAVSSSWKQFRERQDAQALLLTFFVGGYLLRCLLDGHLSGWRLGLFAFICGVLVAAMKDSRRPA